MGAHACALAGGVVLALAPGPTNAAFVLVRIGAGYGIVSGLAAAAVAQYWHKNQLGRIASRAYIAWCAAAVTLPMLAGALFDRTGSSASAAWVAGGGNVVGGLLVARLLPVAAKAADLGRSSSEAVDRLGRGASRRRWVTCGKRRAPLRRYRDRRSAW